MEYGACTTALKRLGIHFEIADYVEIDRYAVQSYNSINGTSFEPQDVCKWDKDIQVDLIMHGSPCQDFSVAGKQAGGDENSGTRSSLMYETLRIVNKLKPKYVIWENVKNLLSKKHRHNFDRYVDIMHEGGYNSYYQVLNAKDYGIPQNRERVFTISIRKDIDTGYEFPKKEELKLRLKDLLEPQVDEKYYLSGKQVERMKTTTYESAKTEKRVQNEICRTLTARDWKDPKCVQIGELDIKGHDCIKRVYSDEGISPTLTNMQGGNRQPKIIDNRNLKEQLCDNLIENNMVKENDVIRHSYSASRMKNMYTQNSQNNNVSPTLDTRSDCLGIVVKNATKQGYDIATDGDSVNLQNPDSKTRRARVGHEISNTLQTSDTMGVVDQLRIRKLTPKECWRLMGFNDIEYEKAAETNSNSQLYKQARKQHSSKRIRKNIK